ncbi:hypothetical protein GUJ93_ZPchr0013g35703 [Zizania palustris]|uniref:Uncharacterized protein n=1 Tax=Zizania palustris TaxID=103762 RepID=A0A8J6BU71_ZIZPA|nr:hypothetical protein GUJ93_ZPchr0013g35703 [Zizania palustris]
MSYSVKGRTMASGMVSMSACARQSGSGSAGGVAPPAESLAGDLRSPEVERGSVEPPRGGAFCQIRVRASLSSGGGVEQEGDLLRRTPSGSSSTSAASSERAASSSSRRRAEGRVGRRVYQWNGVVTDPKSFGTVHLCYGIRKLDGRYFQVNQPDSPLLTAPLALGEVSSVSWRTTLLLVIRDESKTPLNYLTQALKEDTQKIWDAVHKPEVYKEAALSEFFNVEVTALSSYEEKELFKDCRRPRHRCAMTATSSLVKTHCANREYYSVERNNRYQSSCHGRGDGDG